MCDRIPYKTIVACKLVDGKGMVTYVVDEDVKAYIISELTMTIMMKYDPTRIPRKKKQL